jgi:hypothetical protein
MSRATRIASLLLINELTLELEALRPRLPRPLEDVNLSLSWARTSFATFVSMPPWSMATTTFPSGRMPPDLWTHSKATLIILMALLSLLFVEGPKCGL